jgi:hypothetical protein
MWHDCTQRSTQTTAVDMDAQALGDEGAEGSDDDEFDMPGFIETFDHMLPCLEAMSAHAEAVKDARVHWLQPSEDEVERLRALSRTRPLTGAEVALLIYEDGSSAILGCQAPPSVCWRGLRKAVRARGIVVFWLRVAAERSYAADGPGRRRDAEEFLADFGS